MALPVLDDLRADFPPLDAFATTRWYHAGELRYYYRHIARPSPAWPGPGPLPPVVRSDFYEKIDPDLRDLCRLLHRQGIATTPSCQGHFHSRGDFVAKWRQMQREALAARREGLPVRDSETGQPAVFLNPAYDLPWERFEQFHEDAQARQCEGYLGMILPPGCEKLRDRLHARPYEHPMARLDPGDSAAGLVAIRSRTTSPDASARTWRDVFAYVRSLLR